MSLGAASVVATLLLTAPGTRSYAAKGCHEARRLAFGSGKHWILIDPATRKVESVTLPGAHSAVELVASRDGADIVFTEGTAEGTSFLFEWDRRGGGEPISIGDATGFHSDPAFSWDERWVYFAHNPSSAGTPGAHALGAYAQIYRVAVHGGPIKQLTQGAGCHFLPAAAGPEQLYWVHSSCIRMQWLEHRTGSPELHRLDSGLGAFNNLSALPDGTLLIAYRLHGKTQVLEQDATGASKPLFSLKTSRERPIVQFGCNDDEIYYQDHGKVWRWGGKQAVVVRDLQEAP